MFLRSWVPHYPQPDGDAIGNLSMAVVVDQSHLGGGSHSTLDTVTCQGLDVIYVDLIFLAYDRGQNIEYQLPELTQSAFFYSVVSA